MQRPIEHLIAESDPKELVKLVEESGTVITELPFGEFKPEFDIAKKYFEDEGYSVESKSEIRTKEGKFVYYRSLKVRNK